MLTAGLQRVLGSLRATLRMSADEQSRWAFDALVKIVGGGRKAGWNGWEATFANEKKKLRSGGSGGEGRIFLVF